MDFRKLGEKALRTGLKQGIGYMRRSGRDTTALRVIDGLLSGDEGSAESGAGRARGRKTLDSGGRDTGEQNAAGREPGASRSEQGRPRSGGSSSTAPGRVSPRGSVSSRDSGAEVRRELETARPAPRSRPEQGFPKRPDAGYPGDYTGEVKPVYAPDLDGKADPGEVVWAWVPYEEDHTQGKDRPVLVIGHDESWLLGLMLTSKDNVAGGVGDVHETASARYINIGSGEWDSQGRPSEVRLDRIIRIAPGAVRREGSIMPMDRFAKIVDAV